ncbi:unnamed protein product [Trichobilharzia regenti]|nr:unnamed protein product [Trichobilharzia regenti]
MVASSGIQDAHFVVFGTRQLDVGPSGLVDNALAFETMGTGFDPPRGPSGLVDNALAFETMGTGFEPRVRGLVDNALPFETMGTGFEPRWERH